MSEMLADSMVTEANMMQYLGMIEQRTNEILQLYATVSAPPVEQASKHDQSSGADPSSFDQRPWCWSNDAYGPRIDTNQSTKSERLQFRGG